MNFFTPPFKNIKFVGSCNGLICLAENQYVWICNPITREYVMLPEIKSEICEIDGRVYRGNSFGFVSSTNEYKVLGIYVKNFSSLEVHIYTLGSGNGWRYLGNCNSEFKVCDYNWVVAGVFANEALYWLDDRSIIISNFDLAEEKFCEHLSPPRLLQESEWWCSRIGVLNGCFFFVIPLEVKRDPIHEVWLLRKKNYNHDMKERDEHQSLGWIKEFGVDNSRLLAITKSSCILTYNGNYLNIYDPKASTSKMLVDLNERIREVFPHKNTLVSLNELREEGTKTVMQLKETESMIRLSSS